MISGVQGVITYFTEKKLIYKNFIPMIPFKIHFFD